MPQMILTATLNKSEHRGGQKEGTWEILDQPYESLRYGCTTGVRLTFPEIYFDVITLLKSDQLVDGQIFRLYYFF